MRKSAKRCFKWLFVISPCDIHMLRFILEAYEGIGLVTTLDSHLGLIELSVAPGCEDEMARVLTAEKQNLQLRPVWIENEGKHLNAFTAQSGGNPPPI